MGSDLYQFERYSPLQRLADQEAHNAQIDAMAAEIDRLDGIVKVLTDADAKAKGYVRAIQKHYEDLKATYDRREQLLRDELSKNAQNIRATAARDVQESLESWFEEWKKLCV